MGNYAHGNQPIQHMIYLYDYAGQPWKAQYWLRQEMCIRDRRMHRWMRYAAVIAVILLMGGGTGYWFYHNGADQQLMVAVANEGSVKEVVLPDGTRVGLNNLATLKYPREFSEKERNVYLEGLTKFFR